MVNVCVCRCDAKLMLDDEYTVESIPQIIYTDEEHNKNEQSYTGTGLTDSDATFKIEK